MGIATILEARKILLLASGATKAEILRRALRGPVSEAVPASALQLHRDVVVIADEAGPIAIGGLNGTKSVNAVNGIATFNNLSVTGLCTGCWLTATAAGLTGATSGTFSVIGP